MPFSEERIGEFAARVGERSPAPASGSATAVAAALAASLVELTARFSDGEDATAARAVELRGRLLALADEDADAYTDFMRTRSDADRERTVGVPLELAETASEVVRLAERLRVEGNPRLLGDVDAGAQLARAAVRIAALLVELNVGDRSDPRADRARALAVETA